MYILVMIIKLLVIKANLLLTPCPVFVETFFSNPQFWLKINEMDAACDQGQSNVLVSLIQKPDKRNRRLASHHGIGFCVFAVSIHKKMNKHKQNLQRQCIWLYNDAFVLRV